MITSLDAPRAIDPRVLPCRTSDQELWFTESPAKAEEAKALCQTCPVKIDCLEGALRRREPWGIWGGQIFANGRIQRVKRPRGRPRLNPVAA